MNRKGFDMGTIVSIVELIVMFSISSAAWSSVGEERRLGGGGI